MSVDVIKTKKTTVNVGRNYDNDMDYSVSMCDTAEGEVYIEAKGRISGRAVSYDLEMPLSDIPYLTDLLREFADR